MPLVTITTASILRDTAAGREAAGDAYELLNNRGTGFDPSDRIASWTLVRDAENTSDVAVYTYDTDVGERMVVLVATDGTGSEESRWAVEAGADE